MWCAIGQSAFYEDVAAARPRGPQEPGVDQPDAPPPLEAELAAEGAAGAVPGAIPRATLTLRCSPATERVSGAKEHPGKTGHTAAAPVAWATGAVRLQSRECPGQHA